MSGMIPEQVYTVLNCIVSDFAESSPQITLGSSYVPAVNVNVLVAKMHNWWVFMLMSLYYGKMQWDIAIITFTNTCSSLKYDSQATVDWNILHYQSP